MRTFWRVLFLLLAIFLILHGIFGPQFAPKNLSTLFVWVHYRGLLVLGVLLLGNIFCYACPLTFVRDLGRKLLSPRFEWPNRLKNKWPAIILFVSVLFAYELFDLWSSPLLTAYLMLAFFAAILLIDLTFKKASFCKYVCPVGQFNFVASLLAPVEVGVKDSKVCDSCVSMACVKGRAIQSTVQRGCEMKLSVAKKAGNMDCTFCMDCKVACPHDNVEVQSILPGQVLFAEDSQKTLAGLGRVWARSDVMALIVVFTFGSLLNAFGMIGPSYAWIESLAHKMGTTHEAGPLLILFALFLVIAPLILLSSSLWVSRKLSSFSALPLASLIPSLIPLGLGVWAAHYSFHFLTGVFTFVPIAHSILRGPQLEAAMWSGFPMGMPLKLVVPIQLGFLFLGLLGAILVLQERARATYPFKAKAIAIPWQILFVLLTVAAAWILLQPMEMRGTYLG